MFNLEAENSASYKIVYEVYEIKVKNIYSLCQSFMYPLQHYVLLMANQFSHMKWTGNQS